MPKDVDSFLAEVDKLKGTYASMEITTLAGRDGGLWINLGTIIWISHKEAEARKEEELFRLNDQLIILHRIEGFDFEKFRTILLNLNKVVKFEKFEVTSKDFQDLYHVEEKEGWSRDRITDREGWPAYVLLSYGKNPRELLVNINEIDESLRINAEPYEDLSDLSSRYLFPVGAAYSTGMYVIAYKYIRLEDLKLSSNGNLDFNINCHKSIDVSDLKVNVILSGPSGNMDRFQLSFDGVESTTQEFLKIKKFVERGLKNVEAARLYLLYKGDLFRTYWVNATRPLSEEELREDIIKVVEGIKRTVSDIEKVLEEIRVSALNGVINIQDNVIDKSVWNDLGIYCLETGLFGQAEHVYDRMLQTIIDYEEANKIRIHKGLALHNLGVALYKQGRVRDAVQKFSDAFEEDRKTFGEIEAQRGLAKKALDELSGTKRGD